MGCLFGGLLVALLITMELWYPAALPFEQYDFLFIMAILIQATLIVAA